MWGDKIVSKRLVGLGLVFLMTALVSAGALPAEEESMPKKARPEERVVEDTYPLETCVVSGGKLGSMGDPVVYVSEGREIRFCCAGCVAKFEKDPEGYLKKLDEAVVARDLPDYPLETCLVTGKSLSGKDVTPVDYVYKGRLIRLCDDSVLKAFMKDPDKYLENLDEARKKHAPEKKASAEPYPFDTCIVSGSALGSMGEPVTLVYEGQEVKFCCAGCIGQFKANPDGYMERTKAASKAANKDAAGHSEGHGRCGGH